MEKKTNKPLRDEKGRLLKGHSGNPTGRPLSDNIPKEVLKEVAKLKTNKEKIEFWDKYLLEHPRTTQEVRAVIAMIRDSYTPKLKAVENTVKTDTKIEISWLLPNKEETSGIIDVTQSHNGTQIEHLMDLPMDKAIAKSQDEAIRDAIEINNNINSLDDDSEEDY